MPAKSLVEVKFFMASDMVQLPKCNTVRETSYAGRWIPLQLFASLYASDRSPKATNAREEKPVSTVTAGLQIV